MDKILLQSIYDRLVEISAGISRNNNSGICANLRYYCYKGKTFRATDMCTNADFNDWLKEQFEAWPECHIDATGNKELYYPVEGVEEYISNNKIWCNPKRLKLLNFLMKQVEQQLEQMNNGQCNG